MKKTTGKTTAKYNSSKNEVSMTIAALLPTGIPSLWTKTTATLVPPMAEGVTAEVNSQSMMMRNACRQESCPRLNSRIRIM